MTAEELRDENIADKSFDTRPRFVRVTGRRRGFVEFDFAVGEPDMHIEMVLHEAGFEEFCKEQDATLLEPCEHKHEKVEDIGFEWRMSDVTSRLGKSTNNTEKGED